LRSNLSQPACDLFLFLEVFSSEGGIQTYVKDILKAYLNLQMGVAEVLVLRDDSDAPNPWVTDSDALRFYPLKTLPAWLGRGKLALKLLERIFKQRPRQVFCGHIKLAPLVYFLCRPLKIPYTILTYGKEIWQPLNHLEQQALREAAQIWTISRYSRDRACSVQQLDPHRFHILPCAVDGTVFTPGAKNLDLIEKYQLQNCQVLMTVARLWSGDIYKGVDVTIRALPDILPHYPQLKYLVIGRGDDQPRLAKLAKDLGVADRVIFAGFISTPELPDYYRLADAYVMPSQEGFGIVYLEAMACGVPVIAGDADGSADPLLDGQLGWQVPYRDSRSLATACLELLKGADQRCDGVWLRQQVLQNFSTAAFTQRLQKLLQL
jgi:phosphatidylinositol alpha-1,6-mannosyltransferase